jgi:hypothetical protein
MARLYIKRGTRAQLNTARSAGQLAQSELYHVTDEDKLVLGKGASSYFDVNQNSGGFSPNITISGWTPGPPVSNSISEIPVGEFQIGGPEFQAGIQWEVDAGWLIDYPSGGSINCNFRIKLGDLVVATNENNTTLVPASAYPKRCLATIKIKAISATQISISRLILRVGLGTTPDAIDVSNTWDHAGVALVTVPDLYTTRILSLTFQSETAVSNFTITPLPGCIEGINPSGASPFIPYYSSGSVITIARLSLVPATQSLAANLLRAFPWEVQKAISINALRQEVSTAASAGGITFRLAIYADNGSGYPATIVANSETGPLDASTTGVRLYTPPSQIVLSPGLYWLAANCSGTPTLRAVSASALPQTLGVNPSGGASSQYTAWATPSTYAAMPATFPAGATRASNLGAPWTMFTIAA